MRLPTLNNDFCSFRVTKAKLLFVYFIPGGGLGNIIAPYLAFNRKTHTMSHCDYRPNPDGYYTVKMCWVYGTVLSLTRSMRLHIIAFSHTKSKSARRRNQQKRNWRKICYQWCNKMILWLNWIYPSISRWTFLYGTFTILRLRLSFSHLDTLI